MVDSSEHLQHPPSAISRPTTDLLAFPIVLRDMKRHDSFETREFHLAVGSEIPIGRASKSVNKQELMAAPHNAYIDSPVMSREHAILSVSAGTGAPQFNITDRGSMHGTMLNGRRLVSNHPEELVNGDVLQFGVDINRNEGVFYQSDPMHLVMSTTDTISSTAFFVARQYLFESQVARRFSLGFAVPDAESEEDHFSVTEQQGSQWNPLNIDDSDAGSNRDMTPDCQEDVTMEAIELAHLADAESGAEEIYQDPTGDDFEIASAGDEDERSSVGSVAPASANSPEVYDPFNAEASDSGSGSCSVSESDDAPSSPVPITSTDLDIETSSTQAEAPSTRSPTAKSRNAFTLDSEMDVYTCTYGDNTSSACYTTPPPPARPSVTVATPYSGIDIDQLNNRSWSDFAHVGAYLMHDGAYMTHEGAYLNPQYAPGYSFTDPGEYPLGTYPAPYHQAHEMQTPPPMPASDIVTSAPKPGRRTKVSIEEIVEHEPPSPESIKNLKRKAEVLEEQHKPMAEASAAVLSGSIDLTANVDSASYDPAQRPKKQPRSVLAKVGRTAKYLGVGTAGALATFTALAVLPDTFFM